MLSFVLPATTWYATTTSSPHALTSPSCRRQSVAVAASFESQQPLAFRITPSSACSSMSTTRERLVCLRHCQRRTPLLEHSPCGRTRRRRPRVSMGIGGLSKQHNDHRHVSRDGNVDANPQAVAGKNGMQREPKRSLSTAAARAKQGRLGLVVRLKSLGKRSEWSRAIALFHTVKAEQRVVLDNGIYSCFISVMAKSGRWSEAIYLLEQASRDGLEPNEFCYTAAVSACAKGRNWRLALSLLEDMRKQGLRPDHVTYSSAVSAMAKAGQWERALSLLSQMQQEGLSPNVVCYGAAVDACAKGGQWERAVALLEEMRVAGVEPDRICYNTAIHACAQSGQWELALSLADTLRKNGVEGARPDSFTLNSVMAALSGAGQWENVLVLLDEMQADGVKPDVVSYNTAMRACNEARQHQRALSMFADMQAAGLKPDQESLSAAAEACSADASGQGGDTAIRLLRWARAQGLKPGARAVAASLAACVGGRNWRMAVPTIEKMLQASGTRAWDDVFEFLDGARRESLGRTLEVGAAVVEKDGTKPEGSLQADRTGLSCGVGVASEAGMTHNRSITKSRKGTLRAEDVAIDCSEAGKDR